MMVTFGPARLLLLICANGAGSKDEEMQGFQEARVLPFALIFVCRYSRFGTKLVSLPDETGKIVLHVGQNCFACIQNLTPGFVPNRADICLLCDNLHAFLVQYRLFLLLS